MAYRATPAVPEPTGPDAIVDRFIGSHRVLFANPLGALDAETERMAAIIRSAGPSLDEASVEEDAGRVKAWARAEFRSQLSTHFDTLAILGAWILRDRWSLEDLSAHWREAERRFRVGVGEPERDRALVAAFIVAGAQGTFEFSAELLGRCVELEGALGAGDPARRTPWGLALRAMLAMRPEDPRQLAEWIDETRLLFGERIGGRGGFVDEAIALACLSGLSPEEAVDRMMLVRSGPLLPLEPLELGALCRVSLPAQTLNASIRHLVQRLGPFAARGRHEAIRMAVAAALMGASDPLSRVAADVVTYVRVTERRLESARRGGFVQ